MKKNIYLIVLSFFAIYFIWGSTYLLNKIAVGELPPLFLGSIRFTSAGVLIFIIAVLLKQKITITKSQIKNCFIASFFFLAYGNGVFVWALKYIDSGFASLLTATQPLIVLLLMWILDGKKIQLRSMVGVGLGLIGIYLLIGQKEILSAENQVLGILMAFSCIVSWSYASIFVSKADLPKNFFISAGYQMFFGGIMLMISSLLFGEEWKSPIEWKEITHICIALLIVFGSIVAFTAFNYLLKFVSTEKVATATYVNPIVALFLGSYFLSEKVSTQSMIAAGILFLGVYFINSKRKSKGGNVAK
jgi:drug/metabolite transporter (DMT)-like permease